MHKLAPSACIQCLGRIPKQLARKTENKLRTREGPNKSLRVKSEAPAMGQKPNRTPKKCGSKMGEHLSQNRLPLVLTTTAM